MLVGNRLHDENTLGGVSWVEKNVVICIEQASPGLCLLQSMCSCEHPAGASPEPLSSQASALKHPFQDVCLKGERNLEKLTVDYAEWLDREKNDVFPKQLSSPQGDPKIFTIVMFSICRCCNVETQQPIHTRQTLTNSRFVYKARWDDFCKIGKSINYRPAKPPPPSSFYIEPIVGTSFY